MSIVNKKKSLREELKYRSGILGGYLLEPTHLENAISAYKGVMQSLEKPLGFKYPISVRVETSKYTTVIDVSVKASKGLDMTIREEVQVEEFIVVLLALQKVFDDITSTCYSIVQKIDDSQELKEETKSV